MNFLLRISKIVNIPTTVFPFKWNLLFAFMNFGSKTMMNEDEEQIMIVLNEHMANTNLM